MSNAPCALSNRVLTGPTNESCRLVASDTCARLRLLKQSLSVQIVALQRGYDRTIRQCVGDDEVKSATFGVFHLLHRDPGCFVAKTSRRKGVAEDISEGRSRDWIWHVVEELPHCVALVKTDRQAEACFQVDPSVHEDDAISRRQRVG